jgi:hypothetical protein
MKYRALLALLAALSLVAPGQAAQPDAPVQTGTLATVHLLATGRTSGGPAPDGMQFLFLVKRGAGVEGPIALKETGDFIVAGSSYQDKTQAELGRRFEPRTSIDSADTFFSRQPGLRGLAPADISGGYILTIAIPGAQLPARSNVEVTVHVGFGKAATEPFRFNAMAPPSPSGPPKP